jgi:type IV pilus assembly protein PilV
MKRKNQSGFTLIEVIISIFILAVVLLAISSLVCSIMRSNSQSRELTAATTLAQDKLESLRQRSFSSLTPGSDSVRLGNIDYIRQWAVAVTGNIAIITVKLNWASRGGHQISLTTLRGE